MKALLFPGQGSQTVGMGLEFYKNFDLVKKIFSEADEVLNLKISKIILEGPEEDLKLTQNTQPAIMIVSYAIFSVIKNEMNLNVKNFDFFAGHSLGEYSALVCSNSLSFKDALFLLRERGLAMQNAVPVGKGGMIAVLGCSIDEIKNFLISIKSGGVCEIANDNSKGQTIVSGEIDAINELKKILDDNKKKNIILPVSAPFHCSLMDKAAKDMSSKINLIQFNIPNVKIVHNVTASTNNKNESIKDLLIKQIYSMVRWRESMEFMEQKGVNEFIEVGPGKVLTGLGKRIVNKSKLININTIKDLELLKNGI